MPRLLPPAFIALSKQHVHRQLQLREELWGEGFTASEPQDHLIALGGRTPVGFDPPLFQIHEPGLYDAESGIKRHYHIAVIIGRALHHLDG
jgi:hypothetical protein